MSLEMPTPLSLPVWVDETMKNPDPDWILPGFIPAQGLVIIAGRPKIAKKSWLAYAMAMSTASGVASGPFAPSRKTNVLFLSREGAPGPIAERFLLLEPGLGIPLWKCSNLYFVQNGAFFLDEPAHIKWLLQVIQEKQIGVVFIDTFSRSFRGDENNARDVAAAMRGVEKVRDAGAATVLVHHLGKSKVQGVGGTPDPDAGLRGSSALAGAYDSIISVQQVEIDGSAEMIAVVGGKYVDFGMYSYDWAIDKQGATLKMSGPEELPVLDTPQQSPRF